MSCPGQFQSRVINKLAVEIKKIDIPTVLDCLRARTALDARVVESILKLTDDDQIETKLLREFSLRASVPSSNFLPSLYLSLLDSCESSYHTARVSFSYDAAKLIRNEGKFETILLPKINTFSVLTPLFCSTHSEQLSRSTNRYGSKLLSGTSISY